MPSPTSASVASDSKKNRFITILSFINLGLFLGKPLVPTKHQKWLTAGQAVIDVLVDDQVLGLENPENPAAIQPVAHLASAMLLADSDPNHPFQMDGDVRKSLLGL